MSMDTQENKSHELGSKEQVKALEGEIKGAFKEGNYERVKALADTISGLNPENRLAAKLMAKVEEAKMKQEKKHKAEKAKEYESMLKRLKKSQEVDKMTALAAEYMTFDPENRSAKKWALKAEKLKEKMNGDKTEVKKPGFLAGIFKKTPKTDEVESKPEGMAVTRMTPVPVPAPELKVEARHESKPEKPKGNLFTKVFEKPSEELSKKSIIDTIVAKSDKKEKKEEGAAAEKSSEEGKATEKKDSAKLLSFSIIFMNFAIIFMALSAAFLYVEWIDKDNAILGLVGIQQNTGSKLRLAAEEVDSLKKEEAALNKDIDFYKGGYDDQALKAVEKIIDERINWPEIFKKISEVTNSVYELNDFFKYVEYNNYSFDAEGGNIRVTGTLSDPLGRNLTKLVELEEAFKYYPKDKNDPDDTTKPYFTGFREFTSFSKSLDQNTGRYTSTFQLSFALNE